VLIADSSLSTVKWVLPVHGPVVVLIADSSLSTVKWVLPPFICGLTKNAVALAGLGRLVAKTEDEYVRIAIELASDVTALQELRMSLRELMMTSPVCDGENFTRGLEAAYRNMWLRYCDGDMPSLKRPELLQEHPVVNKQDSEKSCEKFADLKAQKGNVTVEVDAQPQITVNGVISPESSASMKCKSNGHRN
jgi:protein O-GlcNAc transferase